MEVIVKVKDIGNVCNGCFFDGHCDKHGNDCDEDTLFKLKQISELTPEQLKELKAEIEKAEGE